MEFENVVISRTEGLVTITLDRPPGNTLQYTMIADLANLFAELKDDATVRAVIIAGAGDRFFCAGADIRQLHSVDAVEFSALGQQLFARIEAFPKPVVAAVNGAALGGGCELAMSCHLRIAADTARFGQPEIDYGLMPSWGATQRLPRLIGRTRALEMLLTGHAINAQRAEQFGLVNLVVPAAELKEAAHKLGRHLSQSAPLAAKSILACVDAGLQAGLQRGLDVEREEFGWIYRTEDSKIGLHAFFAKEKPIFRGR